MHPISELDLAREYKPSYLWSPRKSTNPAWRLRAEYGQVLAFRQRENKVPTDFPELACFDDLIELMADDVLDSPIGENFSMTYDRYFPHGLSNGKISRFDHMSNLFEYVEKKLLDKTEEVGDWC